MNYTVADHGFALVPHVLSNDATKELIDVIDLPQRAGRRGLLSYPCIRALADSETLLKLVRPHLPGEPAVVRAIYFHKAPQANWLVPWHQDLTIAVARKVDVAGFGPWSIKGGRPHVQPPVTCMANMLAVRLHLDNCDESNGALRVLPGTHLVGKLGPEAIVSARDQCEEHLCAAAVGDVLLMRPLLLHASSRSTSIHHRRVLHIEYAGFELPAGLCWDSAA